MMRRLLRCKWLWFLGGPPLLLALLVPAGSVHVLGAEDDALAVRRKRGRFEDHASGRESPRAFAVGKPDGMKHADETPALGHDRFDARGDHLIVKIAEPLAFIRPSDHLGSVA